MTLPSMLLRYYLCRLKPVSPLGENPMLPREILEQAELNIELEAESISSFRRYVLDVYVTSRGTWPTVKEIVESYASPLANSIEVNDLLAKIPDMANFAGFVMFHSIECPHWYYDKAEQLGLGYWLCSNFNFTAGELQAYYEKPWKWCNEYACYLAAKEYDLFQGSPY